MNEDERDRAVAALLKALDEYIAALESGGEARWFAVYKAWHAWRRTRGKV